MIHLEFSRLKKVKRRDYAIRFVFGGTISILAALIAHWTNTRIGGIFTAFPAILLASLTLIGRQEGNQQAEADAQGGVLGAIALVVTALVLSITLGLLAGALALLLALVVWLVGSVGLYLLSAKLGWLPPD
jgi:uncharacterized membrane protein (GlpM family)